MSATIKDLAKKLNLSVSTVSYALNNGPRPISEDVKARVLKAARENGYRPNRVAKSLVTRKTNCVGIVLTKIERNVLMSQFVHLALNGIVNSAEDLGQDVVILTAYDRTDSAALSHMARDSRVDGVIYLAPRPDAVIASIGIPIALVSSAASTALPSFTADNRQGISDAIDHLVNLGHTRIAHISGREGTVDADERLDAFKSAMAAKGLSLPESYIQPGLFHIDGGKSSSKKLFALPQPPTAILCANDEIAYGVYLTCQEMGLSIPKDISVIGYDDSPLGTNLHPALTSIRQPIELMGSAACQSIIDQANQKRSVSQKFPTQLIIRASTSRPLEVI